MKEKLTRVKKDCRPKMSEQPGKTSNSGMLEHDVKRWLKEALVFKKWLVRPT